MLHRVVVAVLAIALVSSVSVGVISAAGGGQEKVIVCHKPGTADEKALEIAAPALDAHLAHGDTEGPCSLPQSDGCAALNAVVPDPQLSLIYYQFGVVDLVFYPGEVIHADITITTPPDNLFIVDLSAGVGGPYGSIVSDYLLVYPGQTATASVDYTVVAGDDADGAVVAGQGQGYDFTVDSVNFSCTPA